MKDKTNYKNIGLGILSIFLYFFIQYRATDLFTALHIDFYSISYPIRILYTLIVDITIVSLLFLLNYKTIEQNFVDLKKNHYQYFSSCIKYWLISILIMMISNVIIMMFFNGGIAGNEDTIRTLLKDNPIFVYISAVFFAPIIEELVFRQSFRNIFKNNYVFIIVSALIFGGLHVIGNISSPVDLLYLIPYCSPGVAFAYMLAKTKNIFVSMGFHLMHNGILVSLQILLLLIG